MPSKNDVDGDGIPYSMDITENPNAMPSPGSFWDQALNATNGHTGFMEFPPFSGNAFTDFGGPTNWLRPNNQGYQGDLGLDMGWDSEYIPPAYNGPLEGQWPTPPYSPGFEGPFTVDTPSTWGTQPGDFSVGSPGYQVSPSDDPFWDQAWQNTQMPGSPMDISLPGAPWDWTQLPTDPAGLPPVMPSGNSWLGKFIN